ncbi:MAG: twin-arginine translocase TatA/TatE family subunit [Deltaproteobacteria bacterium]|nr:twin-arginine translocase TatA/TatE family subunit [Deltaproteobacteria bacterium]PWB67174.1 MAG: twin-arginine translocase TatA/TatE family subunit [Deltaproteobacteria bacterium]
MFGIGFQEMILILVVVLIFFGPKRLPDLAKSLGKGLAEFKKASEEVKKGIDEAMKEEPAKEEAPVAAAPKVEPFPEGQLTPSSKAPQPEAEEKETLKRPPAQEG